MIEDRGPMLTRAVRASLHTGTVLNRTVPAIDGTVPSIGDIVPFRSIIVPVIDLPVPSPARTGPLQDPRVTVRERQGTITVHTGPVISIPGPVPDKTVPFRPVYGPLLPSVVL